MARRVWKFYFFRYLFSQCQKYIWRINAHVLPNINTHTTHATANLVQITHIPTPNHPSKYTYSHICHYTTYSHPTTHPNTHIHTYATTSPLPSLHIHTYPTRIPLPASLASAPLPSLHIHIYPTRIPLSASLSASVFTHQWYFYLVNN